MSRAQRRFRQAADFLDHCSTNFRKIRSSDEYCEWDNTVTIKLDASDDPDKEYRNKFGSDFRHEDTLIIGGALKMDLVSTEVVEDCTSVVPMRSAVSTVAHALKYIGRLT